MGGHAAIDRAAGDRSPGRSGHRPEDSMTEHASANERTRDAADDGSGHRWRAAANLMPVSRVAVIMVAAGRRVRRDRH